VIGPLRLQDPRHLTAGAAALAAGLIVALLGVYADAETPVHDGPAASPVVKLRLLGVNDFHGHLEPPEKGLGGAAWLTAHLDDATLPGHTIRVHAGDMVGASPLISSWFHDEPAIEAANAMGFDVGTVGNHEFDEGGDELLRLLRGGRRSGPEALRPDGRGGLINSSSPSFGGAAFPYTGANTVYRSSGSLVLPPYLVLERAGVKVGFIGVTTPSTPTWVLPRYAERFRFLDISDSVNRWVAELERRGIEAIVVLAHAGAPSQEGDGIRATGEVVEETRQMSDAVDVVVAGHSHSRLNLELPNSSGRGSKLIVEADSYGTAFDRVDLSIHRRTGDVIRKAAEIPRVSHSGVAPDARSSALVAGYAARVAPVAERILGRASRELSSDSGLGTLAAEAQRRMAHTDLAVVNGGSFRGEIDAGPITYAELFEAQAYDHPVLRMTLPGPALVRVARRRGLFWAGRPADGAIDPSRTYTMAANELFATRSGLEAAATASSRPVGTEVEALSGYIGRRRGPVGR
jgi:2',3'-cyclic-nucleotide 2'-phosphodiesterase (5'-nucleotidase family)